jgi:hypothetical protein
MKRTVMLFEEFVYSLNEAKINQSLTVKLSGNRDKFRFPLYDYQPIVDLLTNTLFPLHEKRQWAMTITVPGIVEIECRGEFIGRYKNYRYVTEIKPIADLKSERFRSGEGTNWDRSMYNFCWNTTKPKMLFRGIELIVRNSCRAALVDKLDFDFEIEYKEDLKKFGAEMGLHKFNPSENNFDLYNWVEQAGDALLINQGTYTYDYNEYIDKALNDMKKLLPKEIIVKAKPVKYKDNYLGWQDLTHVSFENFWQKQRGMSGFERVPKTEQFTTQDVLDYIEYWKQTKKPKTENIPANILQELVDGLTKMYQRIHGKNSMININIAEIPTGPDENLDINEKYKLNEGKDWYDFKPENIAKAFMKGGTPNEGPTVTSDQLDDFIDMFAQDKRIEDGLPYDVAEEIVAFLQKKGYSQLDADELKTENGWGV